MKRRFRTVSSLVVLFLAILASGTLTMAHSPFVDADLSDWCLGADSNAPVAIGGNRTEDRSISLTCGTCSITTDVACEETADCPGGEICNPTPSREELVWWDDHFDGAVNDLATVATTQDNTNIYFAVELWVDPDPLSLPFGEIAISYLPGGTTVWHDTFGSLVAPGRCSVSTDRGCTTDADCHFCPISTEPFPSTRKRTCGSGCNPDIPADICETTETCIGVGGAIPNLGLNSNPAGGAEYMLAFDFSRWLQGADGSTLLLIPGAGEAPWDPKYGCVPDFEGDTTLCDFDPAVNPGASGGSGGPPGGIELAVPWSAFGCTGCPGACVCPGFGPGQDFQFAIMVARGNNTLDYTPDGAVEDVMSEAVAGTYTTSTNNCPGSGVDNTDCEIADASTDAFIPIFVPGGRSNGLILTKNGGSSVTLNWDPSCTLGDNDYGVYKGDLGIWYNHFGVSSLCSTAGVPSATFNFGAGNHYYLVVPSDGSTEGSYGEDSSVVERPASTTPCMTQSIGTCQ